MRTKNTLFQWKRSRGSRTVAALVVLAAWLFSGGFPIPTGEQSLEKGLRAIGGPLGIWGGLALAAGIGLAAYGLHELSNYWTGRWAIRALRKRGRSPDAIVARIEHLPISRRLKEKLKAAAQGIDGGPK